MTLVATTNSALKDLLEKMVTPMPSKTLSLTAAGSLLGSVAGVRGLQMVAANISVCSIREGGKLSTPVLFEPAHR